jgi:hypothetical protein
VSYQSRQHLKFQALLAERARSMRQNGTNAELKLSGTSSGPSTPLLALCVVAGSAYAPSQVSFAPLRGAAARCVALRLHVTHDTFPAHPHVTRPRPARAPGPPTRASDRRGPDEDRINGINVRCRYSLGFDRFTLSSNASKFKPREFGSSPDPKPDAINSFVINSHNSVLCPLVRVSESSAARRSSLAGAQRASTSFISATSSAFSFLGMSSFQGTKRQPAELVAHVVMMFPAELITMTASCPVNINLPPACPAMLIGLVKAF